tara:strand:- start:611 stop:862 length:252 start_codon:yes stop_codon:yes gene_type:complete
MERVDITAKDVVIAIVNGKFTKQELVTILELSAHESGILTVSNMARKKGISPNGIRKSNCYLKIKIGGQLMVVDEIRDNNLPL